VVSEAVKFTVTRRTAKSAHSETQTHGFEVGFIGARGDRLVLATVKSFLGLATVKSFPGSRGVAVEHVTAQGGPPRFHRLYAMLNDPGVVDEDVQLAGPCGRERPDGAEAAQIQRSDLDVPDHGLRGGPPPGLIAHRKDDVGPHPGEPAGL